MAAWQHTAYWSSGDYYSQYRKYVSEHGPTYRSKIQDGPDLTMLLLIEFASSHGLTVTFTDNAGVIYCSKANRQYPDEMRIDHATREWAGSKEKFITAVSVRIGSKSLLERNTEENREGPQAGDLMVKLGHAALVLAWYPPGKTHPLMVAALPGLVPELIGGQSAVLRAMGVIPIFPGHELASLQVHQTAYFRENPLAATSPKGYVDYLNHRGNGKVMAEIIYNASVDSMMREGFKFRRYDPGVLRDWQTWDGSGPPPMIGEGAGTAMQGAYQSVPNVAPSTDQDPSGELSADTQVQDNSDVQPEGDSNELDEDYNEPNQGNPSGKVEPYRLEGTDELLEEYQKELDELKPSDLPPSDESPRKGPESGSEAAGGAEPTEGSEATGGAQTTDEAEATGGAQGIGGTEATEASEAAGGTQATDGAEAAGGTQATDGAEPTEGSQ